MQWNVKAGQHTVYWGDSLLLGGAVHGVSYAQNSLDLMKGFGTPGAEAKELFRPKGGITLQTQATKDLSIAGQWFYNWQAVRVPESGSYLTANDAAQFGGDSLVFGPNPLAARFPAHRRSRASGTSRRRPVALQREPRRLGHLGALEPGLARRHARLLLPQRDRHPAADGRASRGSLHCPRPRAPPSAGFVVTPTQCIINPKVTNVADLTQKGKVGEYRFAYGDNIHIIGVTLSKNIGGVSVGAELSYRQNMPLLSDPVQALPTPLVNAAAGQISVNSLSANGTPGALGDTYHGIVNGCGPCPRRRCSTAQPSRRS